MKKIFILLVVLITTVVLWASNTITYKASSKLTEVTDKYAYGLHRTDIALCTYWVFYAADKGITPPPIRGYRQEDGHDTSKIMHVLNSIYKYMTEQNGVEPMPMEVFKARKKTINELSKESSKEDK